MSDDRQGHILTMNSGSSSLKFALFQLGREEELLLSGQVSRIGLPDGVFQVKDAGGGVLIEQPHQVTDHEGACQSLFEWLRDQKTAQELVAVGHRVVHGGSRYFQPELITAELMAALQELVRLAPNHLPHALKVMESARRAYPTIPQVACFDTAFHRHMPLVAQTYALPRHLRDEGVLRYGFHGLSYEFIVTELKRVAPDTADGRLIIAHLGNGASMAAVRHGASIDTTMGFTPAGGLVMSTRSGDLDPGVICYLLDAKGMSPASVHEMVNQQAGLLGLSGLSSDLKDLLDKEQQNPAAAEAVELFCYQAKKHLASLAAVLGGVDVLIFTAGIGEHAATIRARICQDLEFLGIHLDAGRNDSHAPVISADNSPVTVRVMKTNEELMIARHTRGLLQTGSGNP